MEALIIYNMVGGTLGEGHKHDCGIPQGCPLSMMLIAFLLRPWIMIMDKMDVIPRILADDILIMAIGNEHEKRFKAAYEATHVFLQDIGALMAPTKSTTFSTVRTTRAKLRTHIWETTKTLIKVVIHARDLGSHLNTTANMCSPTLNHRIREAIEIVNKIGWTGFSMDIKAMLIRTKAIAKALYGVEASPYNRQTMQSLRVAIANVIAIKSRLRSIDLAFATAMLGNDLDPEIVVFVRRALLLRRMLVKHPELTETVKNIWSIYNSHKHKATFYSPEDLNEKMPGLIDDDDKEEKDDKAMGPIGLLLDSIRNLGAGMCPDFLIHQKYEPAVSLMETPWQHLRPITEDIAFRARFKCTVQKRTFLKSCGKTAEIDRETFNDATKNRTNEEKRMLSSITNFGRWSDSKINSFDPENDGACWLCQAPMGDTTHILWDCCELREARIDGDLDFDGIKWQNLPPMLLMGLPPAMRADDSYSFWDGTDCVQTQQLPECMRLPRTWKMEQAARDLISSRNLYTSKLNARQFIAYHKVQGIKEDYPMPFFA